MYVARLWKKVRLEVGRAVGNASVGAGQDVGSASVGAGQTVGNAIRAGERECRAASLSTFFPARGRGAEWRGGGTERELVKRWS